jgi:hypothetical protein
MSCVLGTAWCRATRGIARRRAVNAVPAEGVAGARDLVLADAVDRAGASGLGESGSSGVPG